MNIPINMLHAMCISTLITLTDIKYTEFENTNCNQTIIPNILSNIPKDLRSYYKKIIIKCLGIMDSGWLTINYRNKCTHLSASVFTKNPCLLVNKFNFLDYKICDYSHLADLDLSENLVILLPKNRQFIEELMSSEAKLTTYIRIYLVLIK